MDNYEYRVSIVVPVYNVEKYIKNCLDSLVKQSMQADDYEVLLINDGSTDNSGMICHEYAELFKQIKVIDKENGGVSSARNRGITEAKGKYIFFIDADDTIANKTLELACDFFDKHYDEVDVVSCYIQSFYNDKLDKPHIRYNYLKETGVYDLQKVPFVFQVNIFFLTKNLLENNFMFDERLAFQEDQEYCARLLKEKYKIGYVKEAVYYYRRTSDGAATKLSNPIDSFEGTMRFFEEIFEQYDVVPQYYQALYFHDIVWKFTSNCLYPYHYDTEDFQHARERVRNLLRRVDNEIIIKYPNLESYQRLYWIREKKDGMSTPLFSKDSIRVLYDDMVLYNRGDVEVVIKRLVLRKNKIIVYGFYKSPLFSYTDDVSFYVYENGEKNSLDVKLATSSYYRAREKTETFWGFVYEKEIEEQCEIAFGLTVEGIDYSTVFYLSPSIGFGADVKRKVIACGGVKVSVINNKKFLCDIVSDEEEAQIIKNNSNDCKSFDITNIRDFYTKNKDRRIWLYTDNLNVTYDNGWQQFENDAFKEDGIERYYIVMNKEVEYDEKYSSMLVNYGSLKHKMLIAIAEKLFVSFLEWQTCFPFSQDDINKLSDILNVEVIYLQHGVLHAHLPWYYSPLNLWVDKEVVSTQFEIDNLVNNYNFRKEDLIPVGMPRYDFIDVNKAPKNKILYAPSWRSYLTGKIISGDEVRKGEKEKLYRSNYFKGIEEFVNSPVLHGLLDKYNIELELKLHPQFHKTYGEVDWCQNSNIKLADNAVEIDDYKVFITDFSSYVYDFAVLKRPIMYFVSDYTEFKAGLNQYRELDMPFEEGFGPFADTPEKAIANLEKILENNCNMEKLYSKRLEGFYLEMSSTRESLYQYLIREE